LTPPSPYDGDTSPLRGEEHEASSTHSVVVIEVGIGDPVPTSSLYLPDEAATERLGAELARQLRPRDVLALHGSLGAGKTTLARAILRAAAGDPTLVVPSPTFTLVEVYDTRRGAFWHFDLYRMEAPEQIFELGWEEARADGIVLVEWPERLGARLPKHKSVTLEVDGDGRRAIVDV
jgi:tRNA threonylcarbamoyladenosine biosynthesis protein TsaE